ncbi:hypothetical protein ACH5RR_034628 [Cinchona calisaya]|uniref:Uncharacterized protein n=1 Tax=Cinchona calisaya TaxID=153742 RepID=A0ABD2YEJ6_9GENT
MSSSRYTSSPSSPVHHHRHHRMASDGRGLSMNFFKSGKNVLTKSRSVAFITRKREGAGEAAASSMDHGKKKTSFWSKLLRPKSKMIDHEGLFHSRIMTRVH